MYKVVKKEIKSTDNMFSYFLQYSLYANNLYNITNYYIRQMLTATDKIKKNKTLNKNEKEIYEVVVKLLTQLDGISKRDI